MKYEGGIFNPKLGCYEYKELKTMTNDEEKFKLILGFIEYLETQDEEEFKVRDSNGNVLHFKEDREIFIGENLKRYLASLQEKQNENKA